MHAELDSKVATSSLVVVAYFHLRSRRVTVRGEVCEE